MSETPVVIVTGASRGMGAAIARWLAKNGTNLVLIARSDTALETVREEVERLGGKAITLAVDIAAPELAPYILRKTFETYDRVDALINNAGILEPIAPIAQMSVDAWKYNIEVNLSAPFYLSRAFIPELRKTGGRIINVSSGAATMPIQAWAAYCVAKAGLNHFTQMLAAEEPEITSVAVRPGVVDTAMQTTIREKGPAHMPEEKIAYFQGLKEKNQLEPPEIPARVIAWLALNAPAELSGKFVDYADPDLSNPARQSFGEILE